MKTELLYQQYQPLLFSLAYRMLGSVMDAEDIVQDAFFTFDQLPNYESIENQKAYLCKIVTNRCLDLLRSSAKTRELYVGPWLPEPLFEKNIQQNDPSQQYLQQESISIAYLLLLQQLNAIERAVFILREVFHYHYDEIAEIIGKSSANCRQIFHRAKKSIHFDTEKATSVSLGETKVKEFVSSILQGNVSRLLELVAEDVTFISDGGGKVKAAQIPVVGAKKVLQLLNNLVNMYSEKYTFAFFNVNGMPGIVLTIDDQVHYVYSFSFKGEKIGSIFVVANPDKLRHLENRDD